MTQRLRDNMRQAWAARGDRAFRDAVAAHRAPALFTREWIDQAAVTYQQAEAQVARWSQ